MLSIYQESPGLGDIEVLRLAFDTSRVLITADKDFGEMIFREGRPHKGIILLRLGDERPSNKIDVLRRLIQQYSGQLPGNFVVATDSTVRIIELKSS